VDAAVADLLLAAVQPAQLELALAATQLERLWEEQLAAVQAAEQAWAAVQAQMPVPLTAAELAAIRRLAEDLPALWHAPTTTNADRKRLLRCLIRSVTLDSFSQVGYTRIQVLWQTGGTTEVSVPRPRPGCRTPLAARLRIAELAHTLSDDRIAETLNQEGLLSAWRKPWTPAQVRRVRSKWRIPSRCPALSPLVTS